MNGSSRRGAGRRGRGGGTAPTGRQCGDDQDKQQRERKAGIKHGAPCGLEWLGAEAIQLCWAAGGAKAAQAIPSRQQYTGILRQIASAGGYYPTESGRGKQNPHSPTLGRQPQTPTHRPGISTPRHGSKAGKSASQPRRKTRTYCHKGFVYKSLRQGPPHAPSRIRRENGDIRRLTAPLAKVDPSRVKMET